MNTSQLACRTGLRLRIDKDVDLEVRKACLEFAKWLRKEYTFPVRVPVYVKSDERIRAMDGDMVCGTFFRPSDIHVEPYIRIAAGDYADLCGEWGRRSALGNILQTMAHELSHYFQWVNQLPLTLLGEDRQATRYAALIMQTYFETHGILGSTGTSNYYDTGTQKETAMRLQTIQHCKKNHIISSFYFSIDDCDAHLTGYVIDYDSQHILIARITSHGLYGGYTLKKIENIHRVDYNGSYEKKIEALYQAKQQSHPDATKITKNDGILKNTILYAHKHKLIVSVIFQENYLSGWVSAIDEDVLSLELLDENGKPDGRTDISWDAIDTVYVDTDDEQDLKLLNELQGHCKTSEQ